MRVVKLDKHDIDHLVRLVLEVADADPVNTNNTSTQQTTQPQPVPNTNTGTPQGELSDTKGELIKQAKDNINQMISSKDAGTMVALFMFLLTDKASELQMRRIGHRLESHLKGGGKETDFTQAVTSVLKPLTKAFVKSLVDALDKEYGPSTHQDIWEHILREDNVDTRSDKERFDLRASSTKNKLKQNAINRINSMSNNPDLIRVFSMFLLYLTDQQTQSDLKSLGATYGDKLDALISNNDIYWTQGLIQQLLTKFNPLVEDMAESVDKKLQGQGKVNKNNTPDEESVQKHQQYQQDKAKIQDIVKKYNLQ